MGRNRHRGTLGKESCILLMSSNIGRTLGSFWILETESKLEMKMN